MHGQRVCQDNNYNNVWHTAITAQFSWAWEKFYNLEAWPRIFFFHGPPKQKKLLWGICSTLKWALTCEFQQCGILTSVDSDEPVQHPVKLRNSKWCLANGLRVKEYSSNKQSLWPDCAYAQAGLESLLVAHTTLLEISCCHSNDLSILLKKV